ncbi:OmpA family protein [Leptospira yasudae]|nr:OmpA family protein [Leptospira yasudae]
MSLIGVRYSYSKNGMYFPRLTVLFLLCCFVLACHQTNIIPSKFPRAGESFKGASFTSRSYILGYFEGGHDRAECPEGIQSFKIFRSISDFFIHILFGGVYDTRSVEVECVRSKLDLDSILKSNSLVLRGVYFRSNSDQIDEDSFEILDELSSILKENQNLRIVISGHTDLNGNRKQNQILSMKRAASTKAYLLSKGIDSSRVETRGFGSNKPILRRLDEVASFQNRRIEVQAIKEDEILPSKKRIEPISDDTETYASVVFLGNGQKLKGNITDQTKDEIHLEYKGAVQIISKKKIRRIRYNRR